MHAENAPRRWLHGAGRGSHGSDPRYAEVLRLHADFHREASSVLPAPVTVTDFFAPAAVALLVQHLVLTLGAMSLVNDRGIGLFEVFQVGPIGPGRVLVGKHAAHLLVGALVSAALLFGVTRGLGVPAAGDPLWLALGMFGLLSASLALGSVVALLARSATQAVQYAMLVLLGGLFFGGFLLELDAFRYPVKAVSWLLPVTYGIRLLRDVMLRGIRLDRNTTVAVAGYAAVADRVVTNRFEDLIADPRACAERTAALVGVEASEAHVAAWVDRVRDTNDERFIEAETSRRRSRPDHTVRVGRWRENLTRDEVRAVIPIVADAARIQGYDLDG